MAFAFSHWQVSIESYHANDGEAYKFADALYLARQAASLSLLLGVPE